MKKMGIKTVILAILAALVLISLVGCIKMPPQETQEEETETATDDAVDEIADEVDEVEQITDEGAETEEIDTAVDGEVIGEEVTDEEAAADEETAAVEEETPETNAPVKEVNEGDLVSFPNLKATDPDGDPITYTFSQPLDASGKWKTKVGDAGEYNVIITASDGKNKVAQTVKLIVNALNKAPVITLKSDEIEVNEGEKIDLGVTVTDPDGDDFTVKYEGWMRGPVKETTYSDSGEHEVMIIASDGKLASNKTVKILVNNINRAPKIEQISDVALTEGEKVIIKPAATDPDNDPLTFTYSEPMGKDGTWATKEGDAGKYTAAITVSDGKLNNTIDFFIVVESKNRAPVIELKTPEISVEEGDMVIIDAKITDPENDPVTVTYSGWMSSNEYQTDYDDAGTHAVTITATDGKNKISKDVTIFVRDRNRPPTFDPNAFK